MICSRVPHQPAYGSVFVTPFRPSYRPKKLKTEALGGKTIDYAHEREWSVPHDFTFEFEQVEFVLPKTYRDMAQFPKELKDTIGRDKFILMENYETVERLWPAHK